MSDWQVELEFIDSKSKKFWRARTEGSEFVVNYGRIGTDGQTSVKDLGSVESATAQLKKVAGQKRDKGYVDADGSQVAPTPVVDTAPKVEDKKVKYKVQRGDSVIEVEVETEGSKIETEIEETLATPEAASAAFDKIVESLVAAGYQKA
ncbi:MAG: WGR domain-containing protein [Myxococcota bacterium]